MLVLKLAMRELRGGLHDFRLFLACLVVGITVIAAVGELAACVEGGIGRESKSLLGGDVEISIASYPATPEQIAFLKEWGRVSATVGMRAMASFKGDSTLVELKGVDAEYPLLGAVELASGQAFTKQAGGGRLVIGEDLQERLGASPGDRLTIGDAAFTVSDIVRHEPDRIAGAFSLGPRVIATIPDLQKGGLLMPGSLIRYNYRLLLSDPARLAAFRQALDARFAHAPWIVKTVNESNRTVRELVERLQLFLTLAGLSSLLIGGVGILNATESYIGGKSVTIAIFKALGARTGTVMAAYATVLALVSLLGVIISAALSVVIAGLLLPYLAQFLPVVPDPSAGAKPLLLAGAFGLMTVAAFSFAVLARGVQVKPVLLFRGLGLLSGDALSPGKRIITLLLAGALIALVIATSGERKIAGGFILTALASFGVFILAARATGFFARRLHMPPGILRLAVAGLYRPGAPVFSIMLSIGMTLSVMIALLLVDGNIERDIHESIPAQAPSLFLIDIQPSQKDAVLKFLAANPQVSDVESEPMVRGRIEGLNGVPVERAAISDEAKWATESDRGISFSAVQPKGVKLAKGAWWGADYKGPTLASLDRQLAEGMGLHIGDRLTLNIQGETIEARLANLREVNYMSLRINFALILSPGPIEQFPASTIATLRVAGEQNETQLVRALTRQFKNVSSVRIRESLAALSTLVGHILTAVRITALFTLASGGMVLLSALATSLDKRAYDTTMFKVLGARRRDILALFLSEWLVVAAITAVLSCGFGTLGAWLILTRLRWVQFQMLVWPVAQAVLFALAFIACAGLLLHSRAFALKASVILRNE